MSATISYGCTSLDCAKSAEPKAEIFAASTALASPVVAIPSRPQNSGQKDWRVHTEYRALSDELNVSISTPASNEVTCRWGTKRPALVLECRDNETIAHFQTHCRISTSPYDDYGEVKFRVGNNAPQIRIFSESEDHRSMGLWTSQDAMPFIDELVGGTRLTARIKPYADEPFIAEFDTTGLSEALAPLQAACGWK